MWLRWITGLRYLSTVFYGFKAVVANEFDGVLLPCSSAGANPEGSLGQWIGRSLPNTSNAQRRQMEMLFGRYMRNGAGCVFDPSETLEHYNAKRPYWANAGVLFVYLFVMHVLTYGAMLITARRERR